MAWIPTLVLFVMMLALGMTLAPEDFRRLLAAPRAVVFGVFGQLIVLPATAFAIAMGLGLEGHLAVGLVLIAACPGGVTSNILSWLARGDVALSISLTAVSSVVAFLTVPFLVAIALRMFGGAETAVEMSMTEMVATLFGSTAMPVFLGMLTKHQRPALADKLHRPLLGVSGSILLLMILGLGFQIWGREGNVTGLFVRATPAVALLLAITTGVGFGGARLLGLSNATGRTLSIEIGIQNFNLALVVAMSILDEPLYVGAALVYLPLMMAFAGGIIAMGRRSGDPLEAVAHESF